MSVEKGFLRATMILLKKNISCSAKQISTVFICQTHYGHAVDAKHESFEVRFNVRHVARRFDDATLEAGSMYDLQEWVDIFNIEVAKPEDLHGIWM
jgi:hypothetical protein